SPFLTQQREFWHRFYQDLTDCGPKCGPLVHPEGIDLAIFWDPEVTRERPDLLNMTDDQLRELTSAHKSFVSHIQTRNYSLPYKKGTRGIVTTAGGSYLRNALVSIRMLRRTGSKLPVEIFLKDKSEFDDDLCGHIMPKLNAKCLLLTDIFGADQGSIENYQLKIMAILFSSFEEVLMLDSDCFPVYDPNVLFDKPPFTGTGLVLWPDFWYPSESPLFFQIAGIPPPALTDRPSTEAGEILYSKRLHEASILLAAYYNYYGPGFYYPLQSQGAPGEGDKETFLWSAIALGKPMSSVDHKVFALGYKSKAGEWRGSAMAQFDPAEDLDASKMPGYHRSFVSNITDFRTNITRAYPRAFFMHVNFPKIDPQTVFFENSWTTVYDSDLKQRRIWHHDKESALAFFGFDVEHELWREVRDMVCEYKNTFSGEVCMRAKNYLNTVFNTEV
ncbi:glycosyltransferase family 71 protein, partial [Baudoinia panamericana UAMH 10762]